MCNLYKVGALVVVGTSSSTGCSFMYYDEMCSSTEGGAFERLLHPCSIFNYLASVLIDARRLARLPFQLHNFAVYARGNFMALRTVVYQSIDMSTK